MGIETSEESSTNPKGTSTRDRLCYGDLKTRNRKRGTKRARIIDTNRVLLQGNTICAICKLRCCLGEVGQTSDRKVLLVGVRLGKKLLCLLDSAENVGLAIVVTVSTNTKVDFARVLIRLECLSDT